MAFTVEELIFDVYYPDPELVAELSAASPLTTPGKIKSVCGDLKFPAPSDSRPYLYGCMVLSFDGKMGFPDDPEGTLISKENHYDPKGGKLDFWMMNVCRTYADAVIMGTGTLKARMNKVWYAQIHDPDLLESRKELNKHTEVPLSVIASIDGKDIPFAHAIFGMDPAPVIITSLKGAAYIKENMPRPVRVITEPEDIYAESEELRVFAAGDEIADTEKLMKLLRDSGLEYVSVEAPGYIWTLIRAGILDEYMLNYSGVMAGGNTALGTWGPLGVEHHAEAALVSVGFTKGFMFTRQLMKYEHL